jgi:hypothetical protein
LDGVIRAGLENPKESAHGGCFNRQPFIVRCSRFGILISVFRPVNSALIPEFGCSLALKAARFKIGLRLDRSHHRFHLSDHNAGFDLLFGPFP